MKKTFLTILACLVFALPTLAQDAAAIEKTDADAPAQVDTEQGMEQGTEQEAAKNKNLENTAHAIQEIFGRYRQAIADQNPDEVSNLVTQGTIDYFKEIQDLALYGTADEIEKRDLTDRMQVVVLRHRVPMSTLKSKDHVDLLRFCVETGLLGKSVSAVELSEIRLKDDKAEAATVAGGQPLPVILRFAREGEAWKVDMLSILSVGNEVLRTVAESRGLTEDDLILQLVTKGSGMDVPKDIWQPPLTRDGTSLKAATGDTKADG